MKRMIGLLLAAAMTLNFAGCASGSASGAAESAPSAEKKTYKVAIVQQLDHASLDEIANAVKAELDVLAEKNGVTIEYTLDSGNNDPTVLKQLGDQAVASKADAIIPIATLAAQTMVALQ